MKYFGTDGFRGEANVGLTVEHAYKIGRFVGWYYGANRGAKARVNRGQGYTPLELYVRGGAGERPRRRRMMVPVHDCEPCLFLLVHGVETASHFHFRYGADTTKPRREAGVS